MRVPLRTLRRSFWTTSLCACGQYQPRAQLPAVDDVADQVDRVGVVSLRNRAAARPGSPSCPDACRTGTASGPGSASLILGHEHLPAARGPGIQTGFTYQFDDAGPRTRCGRSRSRRGGNVLHCSIHCAGAQSSALCAKSCRASRVNFFETRPSFFSFPSLEKAVIITRKETAGHARCRKRPTGSPATGRKVSMDRRSACMRGPTDALRLWLFRRRPACNHAATAGGACRPAAPHSTMI